MHFKKSENTLDSLKGPFMNINLGGNRRWAPLFVSRQR